MRCDQNDSFHLNALINENLQNVLLSSEMLIVTTFCRKSPAIARREDFALFLRVADKTPTKTSHVDLYPAKMFYEKCFIFIYFDAPCKWTNQLAVAVKL